MTQKISIIGSGWLAQPLAKHLQQTGHEVLLTTTSQHKAKSLTDQGFQAICFKLGTETESRLLDCDVLIIAITCKDVDAYKLLMSQLQPDQTKHLIYISSTSVYTNRATPHDETSQALNTNNPLVAIERIIQQHPAATILRFAGLVGPKRHPGRFFSADKPIKNPHASVNLIHLDDCIGMIEAVIEHNAWGEIFNGCADNHPEKVIFYPIMAQRLGLQQPTAEEQPSQLINKVICNKKVKTALNYRFKHPDVWQMTFD